MTMIPSQLMNPNGLHRRYTVSKADGSPVDPVAEYFVLRLDPFCRDQDHLEACWAAAREYAYHIMSVPRLKLLAMELLLLVDNSEAAAIAMRDFGKAKLRVNPVEEPVKQAEESVKQAEESSDQEIDPIVWGRIQDQYRD